MNSSRIFRRNKDGVATIEFTFALFFLMVLFLGLVEMASLILINQKASRAAFSIANSLSTQVPMTRPDACQFIRANVMTRFFRPFPNTAMVTVTAVNSAGPGTESIVWQLRSEGGAPSVIVSPWDVTALSPGFTFLQNQGMFIVEVTYNYQTLMIPTVFTRFLGSRDQVISTHSIIQRRNGQQVPFFPGGVC